jgi:nucleotide-binding universal stress UspA family protein
MCQHILVAVDGSDTSNLALEHAVTLALDQHAKLRIAHVVDLVSLNIRSVTARRRPCGSSVWRE